MLHPLITDSMSYMENLTYNKLKMLRAVMGMAVCSVVKTDRSNMMYSDDIVLCDAE